MSTHLLLGDEAVALGAMHANLGGAFSYPGTPATEIFEFIDRYGAPTGIVAHWSTNEKVAYEEALGMSYAGKRAIVSMKHVGLNVAADPFVNSALTGVNGGLVVVVADDPGMHSSQNEQDSRYYGEFAKIITLEPADQQECYDYTQAAFDLSEQYNIPVLVRLVTRLAHSRANTTERPPVVPDPTAARPRPAKADWTLIPANARRRFRHLVELQPQLLEFAETCPYQKLELRGRRGIITNGIAHNYVCEALGPDHDYSVLKIGAYPIPRELVRQLVDHCEEIFIVEEGYPFIEERLLGLLGLPGKQIRGKLDGTLPPTGELTPDIVTAAFGLPVSTPQFDEDPVPGRPPSLCQGCPHGDSFKALVEATRNQATASLFSDIGCYTLGCLPPYDAVHTCVDMGASIAMAHGAARAGAFPVLCTIGDSTFTHSGMTALASAVESNADMTVLILDNGAVAMTGTQDSLMFGEKLVKLVRGLGVDPDHLRLIDPRPAHHDENTDIISREINHRGLSVIIARRACIQAVRHFTPEQKAAMRPAAETATAQ